uniref:HIT domain-containing protein n=1 Tax=Heterorhabditis bacteriophora TaxID=37862 RepID=A0A1I7WM83_HETBA
MFIIISVWRLSHFLFIFYLVDTVIRVKITVVGDGDLDKDFLRKREIHAEDMEKWEAPLICSSLISLLPAVFAECEHDRELSAYSARDKESCNGNNVSYSNYFIWRLCTLPVDIQIFGYNPIPVVCRMMSFNKKRTVSILQRFVDGLRAGNRESGRTFFMFLFIFIFFTFVPFEYVLFYGKLVGIFYIVFIVETAVLRVTAVHKHRNLKIVLEDFPLFFAHNVLHKFLNVTQPNCLSFFGVKMVHLWTASHYSGFPSLHYHFILNPHERCSRFPIPFSILWFNRGFIYHCYLYLLSVE